MTLATDLNNYYIEELKVIRSRIDQEILSMNSSESLSITYIGAIYLIYFQFKISDPWFLVSISSLPLVISIYGLLRYNAQRRVIQLHEEYQKSIELKLKSCHDSFVGMVNYYDEHKDKYENRIKELFSVKLKYARWLLWASLILLTLSFCVGALFYPEWLGSIHKIEVGKI